MHLLAALLAAALPLAANGWAQLLPAGEFKARDGRPGPGKAWRIDDAAGARLAAELGTIAAATPISIDYEHQTILAASNGQPAPAAGWMLAFEWRSGEGLFAKVDWTPRAKAHIEANEYRYISPVILYDAQGRVTGLHNAALVSTPAILGMDAVTAALAAGYEFLHPPTAPKESRMDLATLIALLGLAAGATAQDVTTAITALMARPAAGSVPAALASALGLAANADEAAALAALNKRLATPDAGTLAMVTTLQSQLAALNAQIVERQVTEAVEGAVNAGKLAPAMRDWALKLGKADLAQLNAFIAASPAIPGLGGQTHGRGVQDPNPVTALTPNQAALASQLGLDPKAYLAQLNLNSQLA